MKQAGHSSPVDEVPPILDGSSALTTKCCVILTMSTTQGKIMANRIPMAMVSSPFNGGHLVITPRALPCGAVGAGRVWM